jgi:hypothetical protein
MIDFAIDALPIVLGAIVTGISALVKATFERRDTRLSAQR